MHTNMNKSMQKHTQIRNRSIRTSNQQFLYRLKRFGIQVRFTRYFLEQDRRIEEIQDSKSTPMSMSTPTTTNTNNEHEIVEPNASETCGNKIQET
jgi:hypothetical protein